MDFEKATAEIRGFMDDLQHQVQKPAETVFVDHDKFELIFLFVAAILGSGLSGFLMGTYFGM